MDLVKGRNQLYSQIYFANTIKEAFGAENYIPYYRKELNSLLVSMFYFELMRAERRLEKLILSKRHLYGHKQIFKVKKVSPIVRASYKKFVSSTYGIHANLKKERKIPKEIEEYWQKSFDLIQNNTEDYFNSEPSKTEYFK